MSSESISFTSAQLFALVLAAYPLVKWVSTGGSDTAGNGSILRPYATMAKAVTAINNTGTAAAPWIIAMSAGSFAYAATDPFTYVVGMGRNATRFTSFPANVASANWGIGGTIEGGIFNASIAAAMTFDLAAAGNTGTARFYLSDVENEGFAVALTGANQNSRLFCTNLLGALAGNVWTVTNFSSSRWANVMGPVMTLNFVYNFLLGVAGACTIVGVNALLSINCPNLAPNQFTMVSDGFIPPTLTGDGAFYAGANGRFTSAVPDADVTYAFQAADAAAGQTHLNGAGFNILTMNPGIFTGSHTYTFRAGTNGSTRLLFENRSGFAHQLRYSFGDNQTWLQPGQALIATFQNGAWASESLQFPQYGAGVLVNGVSVLQACDLNANTVVHATRTNLNGGAGPFGELIVLDADRVNGTQAGGGGFIVKAMTLATGAITATDQSSFKWSALRAF